MTEAQVHPATSASAPEGFLTQLDNPNGNEHPTGLGSSTGNIFKFHSHLNLLVLRSFHYLMQVTAVYGGLPPYPISGP